MFFSVAFGLIHGQQMLNRARAGAPADAKIFKQRLDHFAVGPNARAVWDQRYYVNENFIDESNPIRGALLEIGGEGEVTSAPGGTKQKMDFFGEIAGHWNAPIYALEHRFYGKSQPFAGQEGSLFSNERLTYLTSKQAIADLVHFVSQKNREICAQLNMQPIPGRTCVPFFLAGGSYPGALASFIAQQHPGLFAGTVSSSGVVWAKFENPEFDTHTFAAAGTPCAEAYIQAMRKIEATTESGDNIYLEKFGAFRSKLADFYYFLADSSLMVFQYGAWNKFCGDIIIPAWRRGEDTTALFVQYLSTNYQYAMYDRDAIKQDNDISQMFRQWWWQTCNEFAYFQPAPAFNNIRSQLVSTVWHLDMCEYAFDVKLGDPTTPTNKYYGALDAVGPDTFYSNFFQDIWHLVGVTAPTKEVPAENIGYVHARDLGHCKDMHYYSETDHAELKAVRAKEVAFANTRFAEWHDRA